MNVRAEKMWEFKTANFRVVWMVNDSPWPDLSWDEDGDVEEGIRSGRLVVFDSTVAVYFQGTLIGMDGLGGSIYENAADFRDHFGCKGSYFPDMVRAAIEEARQFLANTKSTPMRGETI